MIILTGGAGFIGANVLSGLNEIGESNILVVDNINTTTKWQHLVGREFVDYLHKNHLQDWLAEISNIGNIQAVIHLGACSSTTEKDFDYLVQNNIQYSQRLWRLCVKQQIPFIYASSAATYGAGEQGFSDDHRQTITLRPINAYGYSKHLFDLWALSQKEAPPHWAGLKFFNVYGPHEEHKGSMASFVYHSFTQALQNSKIRLFRSHRSDYADGEQKRDFVYVRDVVNVIVHLLHSKAPSGIYNVGSGQPHSFNELAHAIFKELDKPAQIEYFDMPLEIRSRYQYFTQAEAKKIKDLNLDFSFTPLADGVAEYVQFLNMSVRA